MRKTFLCIGLLSLIQISLIGQISVLPPPEDLKIAGSYFSVDTSVTYQYTEDSYATNFPALSSYTRKYKLVKTNPQIYRVREYWINGNIKAKYNCVEGFDELMIGEAKYYYRNGMLKKETAFKQIEGKNQYYECGPILIYYPSGQLECIIEKKMIHDTIRERILSSWDSAGVQTVRDGNGYYTHHKLNVSDYEANYIVKITNGAFDSICTTFRDGKIFSLDRYDHGKFISGISYDSAGYSYSYTSIYSDASWAANMQKVENAALFYMPSAARVPPGYIRQNVTSVDNASFDICIIKLEIDKNGLVASREIIKSAGEKYDEKILKGIARIKSLIPTEVSGQKTANTIHMPIAIPRSTMLWWPE